jgi:hypothetical protein
MHGEERERREKEDENLTKIITSFFEEECALSAPLLLALPFSHPLCST